MITKEQYKKTVSIHLTDDQQKMHIQQIEH